MKPDRRIVEQLRKTGTLKRGASFLVACSGGLDSTALAHIFASVCIRWDLRAAVAHVNHGLRPEAAAEAVFVRRLAESLGKRFLERSVDVKAAMTGSHRSLQDVARELRYEALEQMRIEAGCDWILTAHHLDDQAETLLARFLRGAGVDGLQGIRPVMGRVLRPLLSVARADLLSYAGRHGLQWCEDASNQNDKYSRNALRRHVLPAVAAYVQPNVADVLRRSALYFQSLGEFIEKEANKLEAECLRMEEYGVSLAVPVLKGYFVFQRSLLIRRALELAGLKDISFEAVEIVESLLRKRVGAEAQPGEGVLARRERDFLTIFRDMAPDTPSYAIHAGQTVELPFADFSSTAVEMREVNFSDDPTIEYIDLDIAGNEWTLRPWKAGDRFQPFGASGSRKVSDFLTDIRMPRRLKKMVMVLVRSGEIIWLCGLRLDERFKVRASSRTAARLEYRNLGGGRGERM